MNLTNSKYLNIIRLLRNEHRSLDELINLQNTALRKLVKHSYNTVKFYKKLFDEKRLLPDDIKTIEDITKLPVVDKKMLMKTPSDNLISSLYKKNNLIRVATTGSSGKALEFFIDRSFDQYRKAQFLRPYFTNGRKIWDSSLSFSYHETVSKKKWFQHFGLMADYTVFPGIDLNSQIKKIQNYKPSVIRAYGSILNMLANKIIEENINIHKPRLIFTDSELLTQNIRENIQKAFKTKIIDVYGTWETDNIAYECPYHKGYHIAIDSVIMEFLNDGKPVNQNEDGEIVVTILNNYAMPFIRYNLNDIGSFKDEKCSCGRTFPLMNQINGRKNDLMVREDGSSILFFNHYFRGVAPHIYEFQIIQEEINLFNIFVLPGKTYNGEAEKVFIPVLKKFFPNAKVNITLVSSIERGPSRKFKAFISKVGNS